MLNALDGTGPLATGLVVLRNGVVGSPSNGSQDLLAFPAAPSPCPNQQAGPC
jgi:hypothetical protein